MSRVSVTLTGPAADVVESLSNDEGISQAEVVRQALSWRQFLDKLQAEGSEVLVRSSDGEVKRVEFLKSL